ncbi:hypothetical protein ES705_38288 [subsurface metagenome]
MSLLIPTRAITDASTDYPLGYHRGNVGGLVAVEPDLIAQHIKYGITMFGILGTMVQWIYDLLGETGQPAVLTIPTPSIDLVVAEDHSGGGFTAEKTLTIPVPTIADAAEVSSLLIEDCEDAWTEYVQANVTSTADGVTFKIGTFSAKMAVADLAAVGRLATEDIGPFDLSPYKYLKAWVRSSVIISSNDLSILLDDHAQCVSPTKDLNIGALAADTWTEVVLDMGDTSGCTAIISIGIDMDVDKGIFDFWIDQVRATKGL